MPATLIIRCPFIGLGRGVCSAGTYSREGGTSLLHRTAYGHESGVTAEQTLEGVNDENPDKESLQVMRTLFSLMRVIRLGLIAADVSV